MNESSKIHQSLSRGMNYKLDNNQEIDGHVKTKKVKLEKETSIKRIPDVHSSRSKHNIKNTYINKINSLIVDQKADTKAEENKM